MEIEKLCEEFITKDFLYPLREIPLDTVNPSGPMSCSQLHRLVEFVRYGLPANDDHITHRVKVVTLVVKLLGPLPPRYAVSFLMAGKIPANNWSEEQNHTHHDVVWVHELPRACGFYAFGLNPRPITTFVKYHYDGKPLRGE